MTSPQPVRPLHEHPHGLAFVASCPVGGLDGARTAAADMASYLAARGFTVRHAPQAERDTLRDGLDWLESQLAACDVPCAAVFYYAGHGMALPPAPSPAAARSPRDISPAYHQVLVPMDWRGDGVNYRVLPGFELSRRLHELTRRTTNVTAILDCCHASELARPQQLSADDEARFYDAINRALQHRERNKHRAPHFTARPDEDFVRIVASTALDISNKFERPDGTSSLLFTDLLLEVLVSLNGAEPWETVLAEVRRRMWAIRPKQRPDVEGARYRAPFELRELGLPTDVFECRVERGVATIRVPFPGAVALGDTFELVRSRHLDATEALACAPAREVSNSELRAELGPLDTETRLTLPRFLHAIRVARAEQPRPAVAMNPEQPRLRALFEEWGFDVSAATPKTVGIPRVEALQSTVALFDKSDSPVYRGPVKATDELRRALRRLQHWSALESRLEFYPLPKFIEWGRVDADGVFHPFERQRVPRLTSDTELAVVVENVHHEPLFASVFRVAADRAVLHWTRDLASGVPVLAGKRRCLTAGMNEGIRGYKPQWRDFVGDEPRVEWLIVALSNGPSSLHALETCRHEKRRGPLPLCSPAYARRHWFFRSELVLSRAPQRATAQAQSRAGIHDPSDN